MAIIPEHRARARFIVGATLLLALGVAGSGCSPPAEDGPDRVEVAEPEDSLARARAAADQLGRSLLQALGAQLESGGAASAIGVCSEVAPAMAQAISRDGIEIRRVSLRYRNPGNAPDAWERSRLEHLGQQHAEGELPTEISEVNETAKELRYLRPILLGAQCLQCHGASDQLDPEVRKELALRYPEDLATGFAAGDLRGAFSVRVPLGDPALDESD